MSRLSRGGRVLASRGRTRGAGASAATRAARGAAFITSRPARDRRVSFTRARPTSRGNIVTPRPGGGDVIRLPVVVNVMVITITTTALFMVGKFFSADVMKA